MSHIKIAAWNLNGLRKNSKHTQIRALLSRHNILCLTETHTCNEKTKKLTNKIFGRLHTHTILSSPALGRSCGVMVIVKKSHLYNLVSHTTDSSGRQINLKIHLTHLNKTINVLVIYAPANSEHSRIQFFRNLEITPSTIVVGDFNNVLDPIQDRYPSGPSSAPSRPVLRDIMDRFDLIDSWRAFNPHDVDFTYHKSDYSGRLDRFLVPSWLHDKVTSADILHEPGSDHEPVSLSIRISPITPGKDRFFFNTSLLKDDSFIEKLTTFLSTFRDMYPVPSHPELVLEWWDLLKAQLLNQLRLYSPIYARRHKRVRIGLEQNLKRLNKLLTSPDCLPDTKAHRDEVRTALHNLNAHRLQGSAIRSQFFHSHVAERIPAHIVKLEKQLADSKLISMIYSDTESPLTSTPDLLSQAHKFWGKLFHAKEYGPFKPTSPAASRHFLSRYKDFKLPQHLYDSLNAPLSLIEIEQVIDSLPQHRSGGPDSIPYEIYAHPQLRDTLAPLLFSVFSSSVQTGHLPLSMLNCDVVLLHEKGPRTTYSNYRPISILNSDYRILTRILVNRLNPVAKFLVHPDQTGFIPGRLISDNGMLLTSMLEYAEWDPSFTGRLLFLDFEKAFDSIEWTWIFDTLTAFGIPPAFITLIRMCYHAPHACIIVNGHRSRPFTVGRGVRQGCPLSPLLFALAIKTSRRIYSPYQLNQGYLHSSFQLPC